MLTDLFYNFFLNFFKFLNFFYYREAETVDPRSGHPVPQGDSSKSFARFWGLRCGGGVSESLVGFVNGFELLFFI